MFAYHVRLALLSLKKNPALTALIIGAFALGIGVCMTTLTVYYQMSNNPIVHKNDVLYAVALDSWDPVEPYDDDQPEQAPWELTWRDMMALRQSDIPTHHAAMFKGSFVVEPESDDMLPFEETVRMTDGGFFSLFDIPFQYGAPWDMTADENGEYVVVLNREMNEKLFGGQNSVGRTLLLDKLSFTVTGVIDNWNPAPKYYDVNNGAFDNAEQMFMPLTVAFPLERFSDGNTNCWKDEDINDYQAFLNSECVWFQYWAQLDAPEQKARYQDFLDAYVMEQKQLGRFERPLNNRLTPVDEWLQVRQVVADDSKVLLGVSFMFLAVCLFNTVGLLLAKFIGKSGEIGLRRALGASRTAVFEQQLVEVGVIGVAGGLLGLGLAVLGLRAVRKIYIGLDQLVDLTSIDVSMVLAALGISIAASVLAGLYPAWRVCRVSPASYLKTQ